MILMSGHPEPETQNRQVPLIVFLHIPKTAGTSLSHLLRKKFKPDSIHLIYSPAECARPLEEHAAEIADSSQCLSGHINYGIHQNLDRDCRYFSMLRDPVSRVVSHYHFTRAQDARTHPLGDIIEIAQRCSIVEYLQQFPAIPFEQIRVLSGMNSFDRVALELAKTNVSEGKIKVGLTECFFQSTEMMFQEMELGYPVFAWKRRNTGKHKNQQAQKEEFDFGTLSTVRDICALDIELYQHVKKIYELNIQQYRDMPRTATAYARYRLFNAYSRLLG